VHVLIIALDYKYCPGQELTATKDGEAMRRIAYHANAASITVIDDWRDFQDRAFPTRTLVLESIRKVAARCAAGDWFVWFYAGHGVNVPDTNGDEDDGLDQAFVTPDSRGRLNVQGVLVDDDFAAALDHFTPDGVKILCICDCCHSGTICDVDSYRYKHDVYQISASLDDQEAEDTGSGGVLTHALKRTLLELSIRARENDFSLQSVFDKCKRRVARYTKEQDVSIQFHGAPLHTVAWPLPFPIWRWLGKVPADLSEQWTHGGLDVK